MRGPSRPQVWDGTLPAGRRQGRAWELPGPDAPPRTLPGPGLPCGADGRLSEGLGPKTSHVLCVELRAGCFFNCII